MELGLFVVLGAMCIYVISKVLVRVVTEELAVESSVCMRLVLAEAEERRRADADFFADLPAALVREPEASERRAASHSKIGRCVNRSDSDSDADVRRVAGGAR